MLTTMTRGRCTNEEVHQSFSVDGPSPSMGGVSDHYHDFDVANDFPGHFSLLRFNPIIFVIVRIVPYAWSSSSRDLSKN